MPLIFCKNYSPQVLKANMRICGAVEYALVLYRDRLPKFRNDGKMIFNWFEWKRDSAKEYPKIHPAQKPVNVLKRLISIFTDEGDVVIDPCAGSGSTLRACMELLKRAEHDHARRVRRPPPRTAFLRFLFQKPVAKMEILRNVEVEITVKSSFPR